MRGLWEYEYYVWSLEYGVVAKEDFEYRDIEICTAQLADAWNKSSWLFGEEIGRNNGRLRTWKNNIRHSETPERRKTADMITLSVSSR